jgi:general secretion pathway protein J
MTLVEVVLAFSILAVIVVVLVASLRAGLRAWEAGQRQAAAQQELRAIVELLTEALASAHPYRGRLGGAPERVVLFEGEQDAVRFVTTAPTLGLDAPAAPFHAVTLERATPDVLHLVEGLVPNEEPFAKGTRTVLSRAVTGLKLAYRDEHGAWLDRWDGKSAGGLPGAVRIELTIRTGKQSQALPPLLVRLPLGKGAA